jgi:alkanesulfonate monooxygenase SsuD/methylene tetrahydromethanopterin reductase-like flavin-dependent oxidoreductase (luciferase family)
VLIGTSLPQFRHDAEPAIDVARRAEAAGLDGVFVFDHLWPLGQRQRPALHSTTLLGALAAETDRIAVGTLVARVGLVPDAVLVHTLVTLHRMTGGRFIAAIGTGDSLNREENEAYGVPFAPAADRVASLADCCRRLRAAGVTTWIGGRSPAVRMAAANADAWNGWGTDVATWAKEAAGVPHGGELTWGGQVLIGRTLAEADAKLRAHGSRRGLVAGTVDDLRAHLDALAAAGASWAVCAPLDVGTDPGAIELLAEAAPSGSPAGQGPPPARGGPARLQGNGGPEEPGARRQTV